MIIGPNGISIIGPSKRVLMQINETVNLGGGAPHVILMRGQTYNLPSALADALMRKWFPRGVKSFPTAVQVDEEGNALTPGLLLNQ